MKLELWVGLVIVVAAHVMLHLRSEWRYRIAAAWMMTGAYCLAGGFATECLVKCEEMQTRLGSIQAAEPAEQMSRQVEIDPPRWSVETSAGVLSFTGAEIKEPQQWPAKPSDSW